MKSEKASLLLPLICAYAGHILWGFTGLFTKVALEYASPNVLLATRFTVSALFMALWALIKKERFTLKGKHLTPLLILGVTQLSYYFFESYGILYTNATVSGVVLAVVPLVAMVIAIFFLKEYPTRRQALFSILPVAGVVIMTLAGSAAGVIRPIGLVFLALTCLSSAVYKNANRKASAEFSIFQRSFLVISQSALFFMATVLVENGRDTVRALVQPMRSLPYVVAILVLSVLSSIFANLLVNYAVSRMQVVKLSSFGAVTTLVSMFSGVLFLHEPMSGWMLLGAILILFGVYQVTRPATARQIAPTASAENTENAENANQSEK